MGGTQRVNYRRYGAAAKISARTKRSSRRQREKAKGQSGGQSKYKQIWTLREKLQIGYLRGLKVRSINQCTRNRSAQQEQTEDGSRDEREKSQVNLYRTITNQLLQKLGINKKRTKGVKKENFESSPGWGSHTSHRTKRNGKKKGGSWRKILCEETWGKIARGRPKVKAYGPTARYAIKGGFERTKVLEASEWGWRQPNGGKPGQRV